MRFVDGDEVLAQRVAQANDLAVAVHVIDLDGRRGALILPFRDIACGGATIASATGGKNQRVEVLINQLRSVIIFYEGGIRQVGDTAELDDAEPRRPNDSGKAAVCAADGSAAGGFDFQAAHF